MLHPKKLKSLWVHRQFSLQSSDPGTNGDFDIRSWHWCLSTCGRTRLRRESRRFRVFPSGLPRTDTPAGSSGGRYTSKSITGSVVWSPYRKRHAQCPCSLPHQVFAIGQRLLFMRESTSMYQMAESCSTHKITVRIMTASETCAAAMMNVPSSTNGGSTQSRTEAAEETPTRM